MENREWRCSHLRFCVGCDGCLEKAAQGMYGELRQRTALKVLGEAAPPTPVAPAPTPVAATPAQSLIID